MTGYEQEMATVSFIWRGLMLSAGALVLWMLYEQLREVWRLWLEALAERQYMRHNGADEPEEDQWLR